MVNILLRTSASQMKTIHGLELHSTDPDDDQVQFDAKQNNFTQMSVWLSCKAQTIQTFPLLEVLPHVGHVDSASISTQPIEDFAGVNCSFWTKQRLEHSQLNQPTG